MNKWSVVIADDEPNARDFLSRLISEDSRFELTGAFGNGLEVLNYCRTYVPDILLLDIEMPGLGGIETAMKLVSQKRKTIIIFITAFDQYAIKAFDLAAVGYLLKPYLKEDLDAVLDRAIHSLNNKEKLQFSRRIEKLWNSYKASHSPYLKNIEIKEKGLVVSVDVDDIMYIQSDSEYIRIHSKNTMHVKRQSLSLLVSQLPPSFLRIHRTYVINFDQVKSWKYLSNGTYRFIFTNDVQVVSSRSYQESIQKMLKEK